MVRPLAARAALPWSLALLGVLAGCGEGSVTGEDPGPGRDASVSDALDDPDAYDPENDFGEPLDTPADDDFVPLPDVDPMEIPDPGGPEEDPTDLDETMYPLGTDDPDAGGSGAVGFTCSAMGWRLFPERAREFERRWPAVRQEALLYARCGDTTGNQRLESVLSALVAMYEATAHPRYATRFLQVVEALRAAAVRNGNGYVRKGIRERVLAPGNRRGQCVDIEGGRVFCLEGCSNQPATRRALPLADMYLAEPVFRGLRDILTADACVLPTSSGLRTRARRHWGFFRAVLYRRWRSLAASMDEGQFHVLARYGQLGLQVCLRDPGAEPEACALAVERGAYLRARMVAHPQSPGALVWGSSTGSCDPRRPDFACHTLGGACDGNAGEARYDCRGAGARRDDTCWRTRCGVTDVSHANALVGFAVDLRRFASAAGAGAFTDAQLAGLAATLRSSVWCGNPAPTGPYAAAVFVDGYGGCGQPSPRDVPKRDRQRRALALGWYRLARAEGDLLAPVTFHATDLAARAPLRDRTALAAAAELLRATAARLIPEADLLGRGGCARCPPR